MVNSSRRISVPYFQVCRPRTQVRFSDSVYEFCNSLEGKKVGLPSVATSEKVSCGRPPIPGENGTPGQNGQPGRASVNQHCCYGGTYYKCPDSNACFGGYDVNACLSTCPGPFDPCFEECFDKLSNAPPPKGCQTMAAPAGIDCANGNINVNN